MPNIFIRQLDNTTAGASSYSNFSVVVAGKSFAGDEHFDDNGVLQCNDPVKFVQYTLGEEQTADDFEKLKATTTVDLGWQCAYELICNGYTVLYKLIDTTITDEDLHDLYDPNTTAFWEPLTDRTTYDFRYILDYDYNSTSTSVATDKVLKTHTRMLVDSNGKAFEIKGKDVKRDSDTAPKFQCTNDDDAILPTHISLSKVIDTDKLIRLTKTTAADGETSILTVPDVDSLQADDEAADEGENKEREIYFIYRDEAENAIFMYNYEPFVIMDYAGTQQQVKTALNHNAIHQVAATRKDCFAICDVPSKLYNGKSTSAAVKAIQADDLFQVPTMNKEAIYLGQGNGGADHKPTDDEIRDETGALKYVAYFAPWVQYADTSLASANLTDNRRFPAGFHYLVCAKKAFNAFSEWYAVAGYTRGVSPMSVTGLGAKFGDAAVQALQPRVYTELEGGDIKPLFQNAINVISNVKGVPYMWGNRTAYALDDKGLVASHFLNIRQLCCTLKKAIYVACRKLTFDPNSDILWLNFKGLVEPTLDKMQADQGISSYELLRYRPKDAKKAALYVKVRITPIEAVEDFDITIMLEDSNTEITE